MYAKVFSQIFDSSIADNYQLRQFFTDMLILADSDGVVNMTPSAISARTRVPLDQVKVFLELLAQPDPESQTPDADGKRIELVDEHRSWGWHIINYRKYRDIATDEQRRSKTRDRVSRFKLKRKELQAGNALVTQGNAEVTPPYASASVSASDLGMGDARGKGFPATVDDAIVQCSLVAVPQEHVIYCFDKANSRGGQDARNIPIMDFPSYVRTEWKYEQDRKDRQKSTGATGGGRLRPSDLRAIIEAKESEAAEIRRKHCTEVAMGDSWNNADAKKKFFQIKREIKSTRSQLSSYTP